MLTDFLIRYFCIIVIYMTEIVCDSIFMYSLYCGKKIWYLKVWKICSFSITLISKTHISTAKCHRSMIQVWFDSSVSELLNVSWFVSIAHNVAILWPIDWGSNVIFLHLWKMHLIEFYVLGPFNLLYIPPIFLHTIFYTRNR